MEPLYVKCIAEVIGTFILILLGNGVVANVLLNKTKGNNSGLIVITSGWAFAVFVGALITSSISGAHLNPAITIAMALAGKIPSSYILPYIVSQIIGAILGAIVVYIHYKDHFDVTEDKDAIKDVFCTGPAIRNYPRNLISEIIGTFVLVFAALYISKGSIEINGLSSEFGLGSVGSIPIALVVWVIGVSLGGTTGYAINPARDLGPRIAHAILPIKNKGISDWKYAWIPILGPIIGSLLAYALHLIL